MEDEVAESLECTPQWTSAFSGLSSFSIMKRFSTLQVDSKVITSSEDSSGLNFEGLDQSSDGWLVDCLNDSEIKCSPDEMCGVWNFMLLISLIK